MAEAGVVFKAEGGVKVEPHSPGRTPRPSRPEVVEDVTSAAGPTRAAMMALMAFRRGGRQAGKKRPPRAHASATIAGSPVRSASTKEDRSEKAVATFKRGQLQARANKLVAESSEDDAVDALANETMDTADGPDGGFTLAGAEPPAQLSASGVVDLTVVGEDL